MVEQGDGSCWGNSKWTDSVKWSTKNGNIVGSRHIQGQTLDIWYVCISLQALVLEFLIEQCRVSGVCQLMCCGLLETMDCVLLVSIRDDEHSDSGHEGPEIHGGNVMALW